MAHVTQSGVSTTPRTFGEGYLFGVPLGDLGWFASLLMGTAAGFASFFAATFFGIITILTYNLATHHAVDLTISYKWIGLPVGLVVLVAALGYLGTLWVRRLTRRS
jgi:hypothetical protein